MSRFAFFLLMLFTLFMTACSTPDEPTPKTNITAFTANPDTITAGEETTLSWEVNGEDVSFTIDNGVGAVNSTDVTVAPTETTTYTLSAMGSSGNDTSTVIVIVKPRIDPPQITAFTATSTTIFAGDSSTLSWTLTGSDAKLTIDNGIGIVTGTELSVTPFETTEYTLTASNSAGTDTATVTITVNAPPFIESTFDNTDTENWAVSSATLSNPGEGGSGGGTNNGFIEVMLPTNDVTSYYVAPRKFRTDWRNYDKLSLDLFSSGGDYFTSESPNRGDIFLANGPLTAERLFPNRPANEWESFVIPLSDDGEWILGGGATSLEDVLRRVTSFQVRAEYAMGKDASGLDNVRLDSDN